MYSYLNLQLYVLLFDRLINSIPTATGAWHSALKLLLLCYGLLVVIHVSISHLHLRVHFCWLVTSEYL